MTWDTIRTPADRFANLPGYGFESNYIDIDGIRVHYLDEGAGKPVVLFHGEPTWSFLYRKIIGPLTTAGYRSIVPDYPGFGMSDKPTDPSFYTYDRHVEFRAHLVEHLDLRVDDRIDVRCMLAKRIMKFVIADITDAGQFFGRW